MKGWGAAVVKDVKSRGYVEVNGVLYPPNSKEALSLSAKRTKRTKVIKTGWIDDTRNIRNKEKYQDGLIRLVNMELGLEVWPEFYFSTERQYRLDYAIPELKIGIEVNGGIWAKGNSGHSSGKGIMRDYQKSNLAQSLGWKVLSVVPAQMESLEIISLIKAITGR